MLSRRDTRRRQEAGFTLIELLVVIIILGILAAVVVFAVRGAGDKGKAAAVSSDAKTIRTAEESFCARFGRYGTGDQLVGLADAPDGGRYKFLSEKPEYHNVNAVQNGGPCNGWSFGIGTTDAAGVPSDLWSTTAPPTAQTQRMVQLSDGKVLANLMDPYVTGEISAGLYDPVAGTWAPTDAPPGGMDLQQKSSVVLLPNGKVMEHLNAGFSGGNRWQLYDPSAGPGAKWTAINAPSSYSAQAFSVNGAVLLEDNPATPANECGSNCGKVFIISNDGGIPNPVAELFNPADNSFTPISYGDPVPEVATATLLLDGRVLVVGWKWGASGQERVAKLFNPIASTFDNAALPANVWYNFGDAAPPVLPNGNVLFTNNVNNPQEGEIYDPDPGGGPGQWRPASACSPAPDQYCHYLASLPDGKVLAYTTLSYEPGYPDWANTVTQVFVFDPAGEIWSRTSDLKDERSAIWGILLDSAVGPCGTKCGKVLAAGDTAELYTPAS